MSKAKILIVEDEYITSAVIKNSLITQGYDVTGVASTGPTAIRMAEELKPDLILMDITLKGNMTGIEAAEQIHYRNQIPVVYLTAHSDDATTDKAVITEPFGYIIKPFGYIIKPFDDRTLKTTIQMALYKHSIDKALILKNEELEAFSSAVSHDLASPLIIVQEYLKMVLVQDYAVMNEISLENIAKSVSSIDRMLDMIQDLLSFSHLTMASLNKMETDLSDLSIQILNSMAKRIPSRNVSWSVNPGIIVFADKRLMRNVMDNLLANAWKFSMKTENPVIEVSSKTLDDMITVMVRDNGTGFDMTQSDRLFIPFGRLHDKNEYPGTGIGLSIVNRIIYC
ncbi:MAG: response regulator [Methanobacteriota archaeon]